MPGGFKKKTKRVDVHNHGWNAGVGRKAKITAPGKKRKMITQQRGNLEHLKHAARNTRKEGMETLTWRQQLMLKVIAGAREKGYLEVNCGIDAQQQVDLAKKRKKVKNKFKREAEPETLADDVQGPLRKPLEGAAGDATGEEADADSGHGDSAQLSQAPAAVGGSGVGAGAGGETAKEKGGLTEGMMPGENYQQFSKRLRAQTTKLLQQQVQAETAQAGMSERRKRGLERRKQSRLAKKAQRRSKKRRAAEETDSDEDDARPDFAEQAERPPELRRPAKFLQAVPDNKKPIKLQSDSIARMRAIEQYRKQRGEQQEQRQLERAENEAEGA